MQKNKTKKNTSVRFLGGYAPSKNLLGILSFPVGYDGHDVEHTRFFMVTPERWSHRAFEADIVSVLFEDGPEGKCWWLLGKRGDVYAIRPTGLTTECIADAGTGPGKFGYLSNLQMIDGVLHACGYCRQVYRREGSIWQHDDQGILLDEHTIGFSLNDMIGNAQGLACAVGNNGEIAVRESGQWSMVDSPTSEHLYAICIDDSGNFCAAGANGTVVRGDGRTFEILCAGGGCTEALWDIESFAGELVVSASAGVFVVRDGALTPFDRPNVPPHVGYRLVKAADLLWSVGTHQIFCLDAGTWNEWICPDNVT